jgi:DNA primase
MPNGFVSFREVKRAVSMEAVLSRYELLGGLTPKGANLVGACPFCKGTSGRQFQVSPAKNAWYCFGCKQGGNVLDFVAKKEDLSLFAAALALDKRFELGLAGSAACAESPPPAAPPAAEAEMLPVENPPLTFTLKTLDPLHLSLAGLGLQPSTIEGFGAGYCTKGLLKGRLAIPIHNRTGELVAYAGLAVSEDESPRYLFPPKFQPELEVFNLQRLEEFAEQDGPLHLAPEIAGVLRLADASVTSVLGLFDGSLSAAQEEALARAVALYERLVLVGEGFAESTVARLARHAAVSWVSALPTDTLS